MVYEHEVSYSILRVQAFEIAEGQSSYRAEYEKSGDNSKEDTPVPIPNTEVKLFSAEDTWRAASWQNRTSPVFYLLESGIYGKEDTPVPIPNTEVKLLSAEGTWRAASWQNRTSPVFSHKAPWSRG